ncbi:MAG: helical backbone metal receptor [Candidatus Omnitrophota bacterium]
MPKRIVSLAPSVTESLYQLEAQNNLIAVTSYCDYSGVKKEVVGTMVSPNIEKIFSLSPDLVVTVKGVNKSQTISKLKSLGLNVVVLDESNDFNGVVNNFYSLAKLVEKNKEAQDIVESVTEQVDFISKTASSNPKLKVFWEVNARPLISINKKAFANDFIRLCGAENIFAQSAIKYPRVSREDVVKKNPQIIILVTMGDVTEKEKDYWQKFKDLEAVKQNRIYVIEADKVCRPTPKSFLIGLKEVAKALDTVVR